MSRELYGEYDNYIYKTSNQLTLEEQIISTKEAIKSATEIYKTNKNDFWRRKILEFKQELRRLESVK